MENLVLWVGRLAGVAGLIVCVFAGVVRLSGKYVLGNFQVGSVLQAGLALMVLGCLAYCSCIAERARK